jgi:sulfur relay (sulfurtransferase) DsrC/TusE family protein
MALDFKISSIVSEQLPQFAQNDYPTFVSFLENYYEYLESTGQPNEVILNLAKYNDIDLTEEAWINYFLKYYAEDIPKNAQVDSRVLVKVLTELYNRKGSEKAVKMLFRLLYDVEAQVEYPYDYVLRASGAHWDSPVSIKIRSGSGDPYKLIGTTITGNTSSASGFVVDAISYVLNQEQIYELFLDRKSLRGTFEVRETISGSYPSINSTVLIDSIYDDVFGRNPTEQEYSDRLEELESGSTLSEVISALLKTSPILTLPNVTFINKVYFAATGVLPNPDTVYYEHTRLTRGVARATIIDDVFKTIESVKFLKNYSTERNSVDVSGIIIPVISGITVNNGGRNYSVGERVIVTTNVGKAYGIISDVNLNLIYDYSDYELLSENSLVIVDETGSILGQEIDKTEATLPSDIELLQEDGNVLLHSGNTSIVLETILHSPANSIVKIEMTDCFTLADVYTDLKDFEVLQENYTKIYLEDSSVANSSITLETPIANFVKDFEIKAENEDNIVMEDGYSSVIQEETFSTSIAVASVDGIRGDFDIETGAICRYFGDWKNFQSRVSINNIGSVTAGRYDTGYDSVIRRTFIERVFYYSMNRTPTAAEYKTYENMLLTGSTLSRVISIITNLFEASASGKPLNSNSQYIDGLYKICLDREPEAEGSTYWVNRLKGSNLESFINNVYYILLGRPATVLESTNYLAFLKSSSNTVDLMRRVIKDVANSQEATYYLADLNNFITALFKAGLNRNPLESERSEYFLSLQKGSTRTAIITDIVEKLEGWEYLNHYLARSTREQIAYEIADSREGQTYLNQYNYRDVLFKDPVYYSPFSYNILSSTAKIFWDKAVKDLVHPAGLKSFGRTKVLVRNSV